MKILNSYKNSIKKELPDAAALSSYYNIICVRYSDILSVDDHLSDQVHRYDQHCKYHRYQ